MKRNSCNLILVLAACAVPLVTAIVNAEQTDKPIGQSSALASDRATQDYLNSLNPHASAIKTRRRGPSARKGRRRAPEFQRAGRRRPGRRGVAWLVLAFARYGRARLDHRSGRGGAGNLVGRRRLRGVVSQAARLRHHDGAHAARAAASIRQTFDCAGGRKRQETRASRGLILQYTFSIFKGQQ